MPIAHNIHYVKLLYIYTATTSAAHPAATRLRGRFQGLRRGGGPLRVPVGAQREADALELRLRGLPRIAATSISELLSDAVGHGVCAPANT